MALYEPADKPGAEDGEGAAGAAAGAAGAAGAGVEPVISIVQVLLSVVVAASIVVDAEILRTVPLNGMTSLLPTAR